MQKYIIIPDLHGQYDKLIFLLKKYVNIIDDKIQDNDYKIIQLGDIIDKGNIKDQIKLLTFIHKNLDKFILIRGNHERTTFKRLNDITFKMTPFYDAYLWLESHDIFKNMFLDIYNKQILLYEDDILVCTHSPCLDEHIINKTEECIQFRYKREDQFKTKEEYINNSRNHFKNIINNNYDKLHFFGHLEVDHVVNIKKQYWLDTNVKNKLTIAIINNNEICFHDSNNHFNNLLLNENILDYLVSKLT